jgi:hypothetical protein
MRVFSDCVGFRISVKSTAAADIGIKFKRYLLPKSNIGQIPDSANVAKNIYDVICDRHSYSYGNTRRIHDPDRHHDRTWGMFLSRASRGEGRLTYDHIREIIREFPLVNWDDPRVCKYVGIARNNGFVEEVSEIKKIECHMIDVTVPGDHAYVAGGFINHNCQGATVDKAWVDMKSITFMPGDSRHGLAYVALSRTRTLAGLKLSAWVPEAVFCAPEVKPFV